MALFNNEEKKIENTYELLHKYGLQELSDPRDVESVKQIAYKLAGSNLINIGTALSGSGPDVGKMALLQAIVEQNWIIIRQLDKLNSK